MPSTPTRVVITGFGVVSPLGLDLDRFWDALMAGTSGIRPLVDLDCDRLPVSHGAQCQSFTGAIEDFGPLDKNLQRSIKKSQKVMCREIELGVAACQRALSHAGSTLEARDPQRCGITFGSDYILTRPEEYADGVAACLNEAGDYDRTAWPDVGMAKVNPLWLLKYLPNMPASHVAIFNDLRGPSNSLTVREASLALTVAEAAATIRRGAADLMVVGATGSRLEPLRLLHGLGQEAIAADRQPPSTMARPYQRSRDGIVLGEGAGALVLESETHALQRGATIYAEVIASAASAVGKTRHPNHIRQAVGNLLQRIFPAAHAALSGAWHLHLSGRGDALDASEAQAVAACPWVTPSTPIVAAKSYFGNLGAGGPAVELVASCLALARGQLFKSLNTDDPDPDCPVGLSAQPADPGQAFVHLAYSPQGQSAGLCVARYRG